MDKKTKLILVGTSVTAGILALTGVASYFITKKMIEVALNREAPKAIGKSREIITGNENIEETLKFQSEIAKKLEGLSVDVTCSARKNEDFAWIRTYGYKALNTNLLGRELENYDIIINTIPYIVLNKENLKYVSKDTLLIDLASNPGGIDQTIAKELNLKFIWALSLPGKIAPVTSAEFIKNTIYNILDERV